MLSEYGTLYVTQPSPIYFYASRIKMYLVWEDKSADVRSCVLTLKEKWLIVVHALCVKTMYGQFISLPKHKHYAYRDMNLMIKIKLNNNKKQALI